MDTDSTLHIYPRNFVSQGEDCEDLEIEGSQDYFKELPPREGTCTMNLISEYDTSLTNLVVQPKDSFEVCAYNDHDLVLSKF